MQFPIAFKPEKAQLISIKPGPYMAASATAVALAKGPMPLVTAAMVSPSENMAVLFVKGNKAENVVMLFAVLTFVMGSTTAMFCPEMYETYIPERLGEPEMAKSSIFVFAVGFAVMTVSGIKVGMSALIEAIFGHEPGMMNDWSAVKANGPADAVRNAEEEGFLLCAMRYQPVCSPSCPMMDATKGTRASLSFVAKA